MKAIIPGKFWGHNTLNKMLDFSGDRGFHENGILRIDDFSSTGLNFSFETLRRQPAFFYQQLHLLLHFRIIYHLPLRLLSIICNLVLQCTCAWCVLRSTTIFLDSLFFLFPTPGCHSISTPVRIIPNYFFCFWNHQGFGKIAPKDFEEVVDYNTVQLLPWRTLFPSLLLLPFNLVLSQLHLFGISRLKFPTT